MIEAVSTAAASSGTDSSGCVATLPPLADITAFLTRLIIFHGPSQAASVLGSVVISGLLIEDITIHFVQTSSTTSIVNLSFDFSNIVASDINTAITVTVPALTGAGETTLLIEGGYF